jgi:hypothetical protein
MADEPSSSPAPGETPQPNTPPSADAPASPAAPRSPAADAATPPPAADAGAPQAEPLTDGTVPTVLSTGSGVSHAKVKGGRAKLTDIYRRADVMTTVFTFVGAVVAGGLLLAGYAYFTRSNTPTVKKPTLTQLDKAELEKLSGFFSGNTPGIPAEVLTISSSSLFNNRVAIASDLKVVGGLQVSGPTALGNLTVDKVSTLGITNIRGQLSVDGPTTLRSPVVMSAGSSISGNITVSGNGIFGGSLSAGVINTRDLAISGNLNLAGHIVITGQNPSAAPGSQAGSGANANVTGNDSAGTVTITTGSGTTTPANTGGLLVTVTFRTPYSGVPHVLITPIGSGPGALAYYTQKTANGFTIGSATDARPSTAYSFDYWVIQ